MKQQDWIELFKEINDREPNNEELLEALQKGEIVEGIDEEYNEPLFEEINDDKAQLEYDYQKNYSESNEEKLINNKICPNCGNNNRITNQFCKQCGNSLLSKGKGTSNNQLPYKQNALLAYLSFCYENKRISVVLYFITAIIFGLLAGVAPGIISLLLCMYLFSEKGQDFICKLIGAKRIERLDQQKSIEEPVNNIILNAKKQGLNLPDNIEVRILRNDVPTVRAIGMNRLIVSDSFLDNPVYLESEVMFELNRINNRASNLPLLIIGANFILVILLLIVMLFGGFYKNYGNRRVSFWTGSSEARNGALFYYGAIAVMLAILGLIYLIFKNSVRKDVYLSDTFVASTGLGRIHSYYLDNIHEYDDSFARKIFEFGYPDKDLRIATMQELTSMTQ